MSVSISHTSDSACSPFIRKGVSILLIYHISHLTYEQFILKSQQQLWLPKRAHLPSLPVDTAFSFLAERLHLFQVVEVKLLWIMANWTYCGTVPLSRAFGVHIKQLTKSKLNHLCALFSAVDISDPHHSCGSQANSYKCTRPCKSVMQTCNGGGMWACALKHTPVAVEEINFCTRLD